MEAKIDNSITKKHPKGLYLLFLTEMWERFSYYGMRALLMLYLTASFASGGLGFDVLAAANIYGAYTGLTYFTPLIGGYLADRYLGQKLSIIIGGFIMVLGNFTLFFDSTRIGLYIGLLLLIIGNGFFKPNISTVVGQLYPDGDKRKDSAFTIFYMGINVGSLIAPLVCGFLAEDYFAKSVDGVMQYGFKYGFLVAAIGMILGQIIFVALSPKYLNSVGNKPEKREAGKQMVENKPLTKKEKTRVAAILILASFVIFFWAAFEQAGSSLTLFTKEFTNRSLFGFDVPVSAFQSINPFFVLILSPIFAKIWYKLANREKGDLSVPVKMALGLMLVGIGFLVMVCAAISIQSSDNPGAKASIWFIVITYLCNTMGELCLSPIGLSMVSSIAPIKYATLLMGAWLGASGVANFLGGLIASQVSRFGALEIFGTISLVCIALGVVLLMFSKKISKMME